MRITLIENFRALFYAPFYAAGALGAYGKEELHVDIKPAADADSAARFTVPSGGEVSWGGPLRVMSTLDQRPDSGVVAFCEVVCRDPFFLVGRAPCPDFRPEDLAGKRLATVAEVPTPWLCLRHDLRLAGVSEAALRHVGDRTMAENADALRRGEVDVVQVFQPYAAQLVAERAGHVWYAAAGRGLTSYTTFNATRAFLERHPDAAYAMCRAMYRTQKWIAAHDGAELARAVSDWFPGMSAELMANAFDGYKALGVWNRDPRMAREGFDWLRDAALAGSLLKTHLRYEDCADMRFAERAVGDDPPSL
jgi:NitT/TauT family transport system substrate-binding protein